MKWIDLSVPINEKMPVYPGDPAVKIEPAGDIHKNGYEDHYLSIGTHAGTHIDAPSHMIVGGATLDQVPLENFSGRGVLIKSGMNLGLETIDGVSIQKGDIVLFHTGMSGLYREPEYYNNYPAMTEELARYLIDKKVKMVGVDMCSVDHEPFPVHKILLKENILIIENLTNLSALDGLEFRILAFPLKLQLDGSPARIVAEIPQTNS
ncbi:MAG: cyclase family protein [Candidatus Colwellbacteria bacterium]|nr:cyclase family protein [Candidatus Colwellbacteria bacterium]